MCGDRVSGERERKRRKKSSNRKKIWKRDFMSLPPSLPLSSLERTKENKNEWPFPFFPFFLRFLCFCWRCLSLYGAYLINTWKWSMAILCGSFFRLLFLSVIQFSRMAENRDGNRTRTHILTRFASHTLWVRTNERANERRLFRIIADGQSIANRYIIVLFVEENENMSNERERGSTRRRETKMIRPSWND